MCVSQMAKGARPVTRWCVPLSIDVSHIPMTRIYAVTETCDVMSMYLIGGAVLTRECMAGAVDVRR